MNAVSPTQAAALATTALSTGNPDAELLATIASFQASRVARRNEWSIVCGLPKRHPDYKRRWAAIQASFDPDSRVEKWIARTPALTLAGAIAKAKLGFDMLAGDDPQGDDLLHDDGGPCRMWAVAAQGTCDLLRLVGERCGPNWDEPDAALLEVCSQAIAAVDESDRAFSKGLDEAGCTGWQTYIDLAGRAARIPAMTASGLRAKAAIALRAIPCSDQDDLQQAVLPKEVVLLITDIAGVQLPPDHWLADGAQRHPADPAPHPDAAMKMGE